ncbi:ATP-binding protein [Brachyspira hampsonii]|uniref:ATP-binding protein n=1 Tax=Brachyspira hampsonii TaxID=1287055 RepID=UPI000D3C567D|nr:ATP-binding protein [Brachyspira hampsonii]PTY39775.1 ATP-binding protein [Brachyspira hampsonii bv. II]
MSKIIFILISSILFILSCSNNNSKNTNDETISKEINTINVEGTSAPESIRLKNGKLYIANIGNADIEKDGFFLCVNEDGSNPIKLFEGELDAPRGFYFITDDIIAIADQDADKGLSGNVVLANVKDNSIITKLTIDEAKLLNDIAAIDDKTIAVTDTGNNKVYFVNVENNSSLSLSNSVDNVYGANGIAFDNGKLYVATSGFMGAENTGYVYSFNADGSGLEKWSDNIVGSGGLDGIAVYNNKLYVSDWGENGTNACIYVFDLNTKEQLEKIEGNLKGAADIDLINDVIYIPELSTGLIKKVQLAN